MATYNAHQTDQDEVGMFWNILKQKVAGVDQGQVRGPGVLHQVHGVVQDGHDAHQTKVENEASKCTTLKVTHLSRIMTDSHFSLVVINFGKFMTHRDTKPFPLPYLLPSFPVSHYIPYFLPSFSVGH
jgi:hypothetical protein